MSQFERNALYNTAGAFIEHAELYRAEVLELHGAVVESNKH